ncbi:MAG: hypothetical protein J0G30_08895 [Actinomycetales bacterium]|nr:hypothetical protein [Actinomycetales bacterium]
MTQLPVPVHVGSEPPEHWDDIEARQRQVGEDAAPWLQKQRRPTVATADLDWTRLGFEPRWVGFDAADCAAALQPSVYTGRGADEFDRFRRGAESRGETAVVVSPIGHLEDGPFSIFQGDGTVLIGGTNTSISCQRIGKGARVRAAADLGDADGQLARRLLSSNPAPVWRSLSLSGAVLESVFGREEHAPEGKLLPILETELGEPVVAAWVSPDGVERRYVVPVETPWPLLLSWLLEQALPEVVPGAMRRARRTLALDEDFMTRRERHAHAALAALETDYAARRLRMGLELEEAQSAAVGVREGLLYGTGKQLVDAVRSVLESAGITVTDLDEQLGDTTNADLLCTHGGGARLVEVKSASGSAPERAYQDLVRHLREWSSLPGSIPVDGGALVISHEVRSVPLERSAKPYARPEFLAAQTEPVISALDLFAAWRDEDTGTIRELLFGRASGSAMRSPTAADASARIDEPSASSTVRRRWFGSRQ